MSTSRSRSRAMPSRKSASVISPRSRRTGPGRRIPERMCVLGIDPGTANTGYGVVARRGGRLVALDGGCIQTSPRQAPEARLAKIFAAVEALLDEHEPEAVALEELYFGTNEIGRAHV